MKISELCRMIEESIQAGKYPLEDQQKNFSESVKIINRSETEDLKSNDIKIEVRIQNLYTINNYLPNIEHLPGIIEMDILDSFKMLCRRSERISSNFNNYDLKMWQWGKKLISNCLIIKNTHPTA